MQMQDECYYTVPNNSLNPTATGDNCRVASVINDFNSTTTLSGAQFPVGTTTVIWTVTDIHGRTATCQYDVVVVDNQDPTITCAVPAASYNADAGSVIIPYPTTVLIRQPRETTVGSLRSSITLTVPIPLAEHSSR